MISRLRGVLWDSDPDTRQITFNLQGVGYLVSMSLLAFEKIISEFQLNPETVFELYIQTIVREDSFELYGFLESIEKKIFNLLTSVSGIGPRIALNIFSKISSEDLIELILTENINRLIALPGIGKKTANRVLLELRDRVQKDFQKEIREVKQTASAKSGSRIQETISGLMRLGFSAEQAFEKIQIVLKSPDYAEVALNWKTPELLRAVLKEFGTV